MRELLVGRSTDTKERERSHVRWLSVAEFPRSLTYHFPGIIVHISKTRTEFPLEFSDVAHHPSSVLASPFLNAARASSVCGRA